MTVWRRGMLAVCVDADKRDNGSEAPHGKQPVSRGIYRVLAAYNCRAVTGELVPALAIFSEDLTLNGGWEANRFRPLIDQADNADLIAKIKACKPQPIPIDAQHLPARVASSSAATSHTHGGTGATQLITEPGQDARHRAAEFHSVFHNGGQ